MKRTELKTRTKAPSKVVKAKQTQAEKASRNQTPIKPLPGLGTLYSPRTESSRWDNACQKPSKNITKRPWGYTYYDQDNQKADESNNAVTAAANADFKQSQRCKKRNTKPGIKINSLKLKDDPLTFAPEMKLS